MRQFAFIRTTQQKTHLQEPGPKVRKITLLSEVRFGVDLQISVEVMNTNFDCSFLCRDPNTKDTPIDEPVKLFKVQRIKPMKGNPFWEKKILGLLGIAEKVTIFL